MAVWPDHLRPPGTEIALVRCQLTGHWKNARVDRQALLEQREAVPGSEMRAVPPMHFQMELTVPAVEEQAGLL